MKEILKADVHESEIVCLEYSKPHTGQCVYIRSSVSSVDVNMGTVCDLRFRRKCSGDGESRSFNSRVGCR